MLFVLKKTDLLGRKISLVLVSSKEFFSHQSLGALGSYVLTNPQQHLFLGNSIYKYYRELRVHKAETYCHMDSFSAIEHSKL